MNRSSTTWRRGWLSPPVFLCIFFFALLRAAGAADSPPLFERPPELERDVQFWIRIYTEVTTDAGLLHDDWNLGVVYEVMKFDPQVGPRERANRIDAAKKRYKALLVRFARGDTQDLDENESRILKAFGDAPTPATFKSAEDGIRFQLGQANRFREGLMRAGIWEAHISRVLSQRGVPAEIAALPHVESSFNPAAYSKVGAAGLWQFMPSTARRYMRVDSLVDERMDPFTATEAAANLMLYNYRLLGTWPLAITAYNHGPGGLLKAQTDLGTSDIATIVRRYNGATFGFASRNFYVAFLAALEVDRNAEKYFGPIAKQPDAESTTVELPDYIPMTALVDAFGVDLGAMRALNPSLRPPIWSGARFVPRGYALRLPGRLGLKQIEAGLAKVPAGQRYLAQRGDDSYRVRRGDTVAGIAQARGVKLDRLLAANGWSQVQAIKRGQVLRMPQPDSRAGSSAPVVAAARTPAASPPAVPLVAHSPPLVPTPPVIPKPGVPTAGAATPGVATPAPPTLAKAATSKPAPAAAPPPAAPVAESAVEVPSIFPDGTPNSNVDPADYSVGRDQTIIVQADETLGHYADWAGISTQRLRTINRLRKGSFVNLGRKVKLDLSKTTVAQFESTRRDYHRNLQEAYFASHRISGTEIYAVKKGESLWTIMQQRSSGVPGDLPVWLIRQYNPRVDFSDVRPGTSITLPKIAAANRQ